MTTIESPAPADQRARWRCDVGLDHPAPAADPRPTRYDGRAQLSWQVNAGAGRTTG